jgi:hypothetical protein
MLCESLEMFRLQLASYCACKQLAGTVLPCVIIVTSIYYCILCSVIGTQEVGNKTNFVITLAHAWLLLLPG